MNSGIKLKFGVKFDLRLKKNNFGVVKNNVHSIRSLIPNIKNNKLY